MKKLVFKILPATILFFTFSVVVAQHDVNQLPYGNIQTANEIVGNDSVPSSYSFETSFKRTLVARFKYQTDLLEGLEEIVKEQNIQNAVILCGIGSSYSYSVHSVDNSTFPSKNVFFKKEKPNDIVSISGYVIEGRVHAHIAVSNGKKTVGGHLEKGTKIFTFCLVTIGVLDENTSLERLDDKTWR